MKWQLTKYIYFGILELDLIRLESYARLNFFLTDFDGTYQYCANCHLLLVMSSSFDSVCFTLHIVKANL